MNPAPAASHPGRRETSRKLNSGMSAIGISQTSRDVRVESAKRANADIAVANCESSDPKFYGLFSSKRAADELAGKIAGARTQQVRVIERDQAESVIDVEALIG